MLSVLQNYSKQFSSSQNTKSYPKKLTELYNEKCKGLIYATLLFKCDKINFASNFSEEQAKLIFNETVKSDIILDLVKLQPQFPERCVTQGMKCLLFPL